MADDKQERIETLQDRVDELEATVSKMLPSRRDALKLGAAGAVGAVGMAGSASAQNSGQTGTIGTDADRVDVNAEDIDAVSVNTDAATINNQPFSWGWELLDNVSVMGSAASETLTNSEYGTTDSQLLLSLQVSGRDVEPVLTATLGGETSNNYNQIQRDGDTLSSSTGDSAFELWNASVIDRGFMASFVISRPFQSRPTISKVFASSNRSFFAHLIEGHLGAASGISSVELSTDVTVDLEAELYGRTIR